MSDDVEVALEYHARTSHSPASVRSSGHWLDFRNKPSPYKVYRDLVPIPLPEPAPDVQDVPLARLAMPRRASSTETPVDLPMLARLLHNANGISRVLRGHPFRAAACTGALYEIELYVVCGNLPGLAAGVYHYAPQDNALYQIRGGDYRGVVAEHPAPVLVLATGTYWRNAWKYQARTYRHFGWDNGMVMANLLATAQALDLPARLVSAFVDDEINALLALDTMLEVALSIVPIGSAPAVPPPPTVTPLTLETAPQSPYGEVDYPLMRRMHAASCLADGGTVRQWVAHLGARPPDELHPLERDTRVSEVIRRRGSVREFSHRPLTAQQLSTLLTLASQPIPSDLPPLELYVIVNAVDGVASGAWYGAGRLLREGNFRAEAGFLDLEQDLAADAAVNIYFMADLRGVAARRYRALQLAAGTLGGRTYLGAYAMGFGATGLTFFDEEVTRFFMPHAAGKSALFLMAFGHKNA